MNTSPHPLPVTSPLPPLLEARSVTQAELARRLGVVRSAVNAWILEGIPAERVTPICDALELEPARAARFARDAGRPFPASVERLVLGAAATS